MPDYKYRHAPPRSSAIIESLRGLGYTSATALADIIDNSIAAKAGKIDLTFFWNSQDPHTSYISILDDGCGMDEIGLEHAMRLGDKSPLEHREVHDLGRFGLGLKTASFSQCRNLTVASKKDNKISCFRWDLDVLAQSQDGGWHLLEEPDKDSEKLLKSVSSIEHGTIVLLQKLDRIITQGFNEQNFLDLIDNVEKHLSMVFHRYLDGSRPRLKININGRTISPWDPFLASHAATLSFPEESLPGGIKAKCFVLPHKDRLTTTEYEQAAGPEGWTAQQGFYVYRNERLLVAGSWLGFGHGRSWTKEEAHRLARIRLDIPNSADAEWKIDIRKSTARPPLTIRNRLTLLAEDIRSHARRVFAHRGQTIRSRSAQPVLQAWRAEHSVNGMRYQIDQEHPAVKAVLEEAGPLVQQIKVMLRIIEETVPIQRIWLDTSEKKETPRTGFSGVVSDEIIGILDVMYRNMVLKKGISAQHARELLLHTEPFQNYPELVASLSDISIAEGK